MPYIPSHVIEESSIFLARHLGLPRRGKVRDTYVLPGHRDKLLVLASNRISIFDFVLGALVPDKGAVLTATTIVWLERVFSAHGIKHHLVAYGSAVDDYLPPALRNNRDVQTRCLVVTKLGMYPVECIVRGFLTGTSLSSYQKTGKICGNKLPEGLHDGSSLPFPLFTPTTKAEEGHDEDLPTSQVIATYGDWIQDFSLDLFRIGSRYAFEHGFYLADTKFEFGIDGSDNVLGDEVLTPDSSRFWRIEDYEKAQRRNVSPQGFDKQPVRDWGKTVPVRLDGIGIQSLNAKLRMDQESVGKIPVPSEVISATTDRYRTAFSMLASEPLESFWANTMHISAT